MPKPIAWTRDQITSERDPETDLRVIRLPRVKGMSNSVRDALFTFEREHLGTTRAIIRMNKRFEGTEVPTPYRIANVEIPESLREFYS